jgi:hypothetical protein
MAMLSLPQRIIHLARTGQRVETSISCARILPPPVRAGLGLFSELRTPLEQACQVDGKRAMTSD